MSIFALVFFAFLLVAFIYVYSKRKIEDFYLKRGIYFLVGAMILRIVISIIAIVCLSLNENDMFDIYDGLMMLKMQTFSLSVPLYFYVMVTTSLNFSAYEFSKSIYQVIHPVSKAAQAEQDLQVNKCCLTKVSVRIWYLIL